MLTWVCSWDLNWHHEGSWDKTEMELSGKQQEEGTPNTGPIGQAAVLWHHALELGGFPLSWLARGEQSTFCNQKLFAHSNFQNADRSIQQKDPNPDKITHSTGSGTVPLRPTSGCHQHAEVRQPHSPSATRSHLKVNIMAWPSRCPLTRRGALYLRFFREKNQPTAGLNHSNPALFGGCD